MKREFEKYCKSIGLGKKDRLLLAVSGGVDSMVLWQLLKGGGYFFEVAHVNFNLRGGESKKDEQFVKARAQKDKVRCHLNSFETEVFARDNQLSVQMAARRLRYDWFEKILETHNFRYLLTAHHLDDAFETFLINVNRGSGIKGLTGIGQRENLRRPLINFNKNEIREFAEKERVSFREDASNDDVKYERNWFRHEIIEAWKNRNPSILKTMQKNFERWNELDRLIDNLLNNKIQEINEIGESFQFNISSILEFEAPISLLHALFSPKKFTESQLFDIYKCMQEKKIGAQFISQNRLITVDREYLFLSENKGVQSDKPIYIKKFPFILRSPIDIRIEVIKRNEFKLGITGYEFIDLNKLSLPFTIRKWKDGDSMVPLGMNGEKKISDILIDKKVPREKKSRIYVLASEEEIICILGIGISEHVKVTHSTEKVLKISFDEK